MKARFDFPAIAPDAYEAVADLDTYVRKASGIEPRLLHLLKLRASQMNGGSVANFLCVEFNSTYRCSHHGRECFYPA
jgi:alkylhydroperoxidase family enzyme